MVIAMYGDKEQLSELRAEKHDLERRMNFLEAGGLGGYQYYKDLADQHACITDDICDVQDDKLITDEEWAWRLTSYQQEDNDIDDSSNDPADADWADIDQEIESTESFDSDNESYDIYEPESDGKYGDLFDFDDTALTSDFEYENPDYDGTTEHQLESDETENVVFPWDDEWSEESDPFDPY